MGRALGFVSPEFRVDLIRPSGKARVDRDWLVEARFSILGGSWFSQLSRNSHVHRCSPSPTINSTQQYVALDRLFIDVSVYNARIIGPEHR